VCDETTTVAQGTFIIPNTQGSVEPHTIFQSYPTTHSCPYHVIHGNIPHTLSRARLYLRVPTSMDDPYTSSIKDEAAYIIKAHNKSFYLLQLSPHEPSAISKHYRMLGKKAKAVIVHVTHELPPVLMDILTKHSIPTSCSAASMPMLYHKVKRILSPKIWRRDLSFYIPCQIYQAHKLCPLTQLPSHIQPRSIYGLLG